ncbi:HutD family protein [Clostridium sp. BJN0001]|uniref:HutD family protein n=1 Tax=Clostridium sp. BJN0001 TaxID=2930219 RepID=UPI001FD5949B|nr:HutD family protein [Clostridium sp. BJN0001]
MKYKIIKKEDYDVINWSGGTTTQLYIYPEDSEYKKRDFYFRISSATVEDEKSEFTYLPDINRKLMILSGNIEITHNKSEKKKMKQYDIDSFSGEDYTVSYGKAKDFNLMMKSCYNGNIEHISINPESEHVLNLNIKKKRNIINCIYNIKNKILFYVDDEIVELNEKETLIIEIDKPMNSRLRLLNPDASQSELVLSSIYGFN